MKVTLPLNKGTSNLTELDYSHIVIVGANGSGKTRLGSYLEQKNFQQSHRISAQKSLSMPSEVSTKSMKMAESEFLYGGFNENQNWSMQVGRFNWRWNQKPNTYLLNDFDKLMILLHTEEYEESLKYKEGSKNNNNFPIPESKLDRIQKIWEELLPHHKLIKRAGKIEVFANGHGSEIYNSSEMSDGERVIFYLIGEVICVKENSLIIIDEPEMHLHKSIINKLWDRLERERQDCTFVYLTHDIDFASSRKNAKKIWVKSFMGGEIWDYEVLDDETPIPENLYLEILGSRKPILFIEGDNSSLDFYLYRQVFSDCTVKPLGDCKKVFDATKAFKSNKGFHNIESFGIVDRDRRGTDDIKEVTNAGVWVSKVAEVENFLLLEGVIKVVATRMGKNSDIIVQNVKNNVIELFSKDCLNQSVQHTEFSIKRIFSKELNPKAKDIGELKNELESFWRSQDIEKIYNEYKRNFEDLINKKNYNGILEVYNHKGLLPLSGVIKDCGIADKKNYFDFVIKILKENSEESKKIKSEIIKMIEK